MQNNILNDMQMYMLTNENILTYTMYNDIKNVDIKNVDIKNADIKRADIKKVDIKNADIFFISKSNDKLFWCFYVILFGEHKYELNNNFKEEKEFKIGTVEKLRKIKPELKAMKLSLTEIERELVHSNKIGIKSLIALCLLYKLNVIYVWNRKYMEIINNNNNEKENNIIICDDNINKLLREYDQEKINYYKENYLCIENISKPLKAIASYSKSELLKMAEKLNINNVDNKKLKKDIYTALKANF